MNTNAVANEVELFLKSKHARVYRNNRPLKNPVFPYVVYKVESALNSYPSEDMYVNVYIYESSLSSSDTIEDLADNIDNDLNLKVIDTNILNLYFDREQRQYVTPEELVSMHLINLRYVVRAYFK